MSARRVVLRAGADLDGFRRAVRSLVAAEIAPDQVSWDVDAQAGLFGIAAPVDAPPLSLPRKLGELIGEVVPHRDPERYGLLYDAIWRVHHGERNLLEVASDPVVHRLDLLARAVRRDIHKMHAYVRFRKVEEPPTVSSPSGGGGGRKATDEGGPVSGKVTTSVPHPSGASRPTPSPEGEEKARERFAAWFEPEHYILEAATPFFVERFRAMEWLIVTPVGSAHWDGRELRLGPPGVKADTPDGDGFEAGWTAYYESIFNPARTNPTLMRSHMAKKYWRNMPEAAAIPNLVRSAQARVTAMIDKEATVPVKKTPAGALAAMLDTAPTTLAELNDIIRRSGPLVPGATQAVVGEGPDGARIAFVGEQPGDEEDLKGRPFVGPAGRLFDRAMGEAGLDRGQVYLTNAVKHFKFEQRGKRRIHSKPTAGEVSHYRWWLMRELELVGPKLVVALGGTAVLALTGKSIPITRARGPATLLEDRAGYITVHPSYLLRLPDEDAKAAAYGQFVQDLARVKSIGFEGREAA